MFGNVVTKIYLKYIEKKGFKHGKNFNIEKGANIDAAFCYLISCGNNVTLAKDVYCIAHDASMKKILGKTKIGEIKIGDNVFVGARSVILPGVTVGDNVIIAANSTVTKSIPDGVVCGGSPAKKIMSTQEFIHKHQEGIKLHSVEKSTLTEALALEKEVYID